MKSVRSADSSTSFAMILRPTDITEKEAWSLLEDDGGEITPEGSDEETAEMEDNIMEPDMTPARAGTIIWKLKKSYLYHWFLWLILSLSGAWRR